MADNHSDTPIPIFVNTDPTSSLTPVTASNPFPVITTRPFDDHKCDLLDAVDTAFNFFGPVADQQFVITGVLVTARENVNPTTPAEIIIYEATADDSLVETKVLHKIYLVRNERDNLLGLSQLVSQGVFINAKTNDGDVHITILGNFIPEVL